jgi:hypothetical protein
MVENIELILISLLILILSIISFLPLIYLNYAMDLNNNINNYNNICDSKKNIYESNINIKNTYMWNLCNHLFDFNVIQKNFKKYTDENKPIDKHNDIININRDLSIVNGEFNIMKVYNDYLHSSLPLFIVMWIFFILHIINISYNIKNKDSILKYNYFLHSSSYLFLHVAVITIIFSLILKKITEIYADTKAYEYIMLLKEFDILIKENKTEPAFPNNQFMTIIKNYSGDDISSAADIIFTKDLIDELTDLHRNIIGNGEYLRNINGYKITLENIDNFRYYNNKKTIEKCNEEIEDVTRFAIVYFIIFFFPVYMLSQASKSNFTTNAVITIVIFVIFISGYIVKKKLE